jgi:hypothetical protein
MVVSHNNILVNQIKLPARKVSYSQTSQTPADEKALSETSNSLDPSSITSVTAKEDAPTSNQISKNLKDTTKNSAKSLPDRAKLAVIAAATSLNLAAPVALAENPANHNLNINSGSDQASQTSLVDKELKMATTEKTTSAAFIENKSNKSSVNYYNDLNGIKALQRLFPKLNKGHLKYETSNNTANYGQYNPKKDIITINPKNITKLGNVLGIKNKELLTNMVTKQEIAHRMLREAKVYYQDAEVIADTVNMLDKNERPIISTMALYHAYNSLNEVSGKNDGYVKKNHLTRLATMKFLKANSPRVYQKVTNNVDVLAPSFRLPSENKKLIKAAFNKYVSVYVLNKAKFKPREIPDLKRFVANFDNLNGRGAFSKLNAYQYHTNVEQMPAAYNSKFLNFK